MVKAIEMNPEDAPEFIKKFVKKCTDGHVLIGPIVWQASDGQSSKQWYMNIATGSPLTVDRILLNGFSDEEREEIRTNFMIAVTMLKQACVIQSFECEYQMAKMMHAIWPGPKSNRILQSMKATHGVGTVGRPD